jgi:hypothetical protein
MQARAGQAWDELLGLVEAYEELGLLVIALHPENSTPGLARSAPASC